MVNNPANWQRFTGSFARNASVVQPGAGGVVADLGALPAGVYSVQAFGTYGGTADAIDNMSLFLGDRLVTNLPVVPVANSGAIIVPLPAVVVLEGQHLQIRAVLAGGVGSVYRGTIIATPVQSLDPV
jgi:hypothetical protein